jgi:hypothetical protein
MLKLEKKHAPLRYDKRTGHARIEKWAVLKRMNVFVLRPILFGIHVAGNG